jgi:hypothetical protein
MFVLKVILEKGTYRPNTKHANGGIDLVQDFAFKHLFPEGYCPWVYHDLLFELAHLHGWNVEKEEIKDSNMVRTNIRIINKKP